VPTRSVGAACPGRFGGAAADSPATLADPRRRILPAQLAAGDDWQDTGLVFTTHHGAALDAANVQKMFKRVCTAAGIGDGWAPRVLRTSFVSLLSHRGVCIEEIPASSGTPPPAPPKSSTAANYDPSSPPAPRSWTSYSQEPSLAPVWEPSRTRTRGVGGTRRATSVSGEPGVLPLCLKSR